MDYEIPFRIKDEKNNIYCCAIRTEYNDEYCYFVSDNPSFDGRTPFLTKTTKGFEYSWILRDFNNDKNWSQKFKGKRKEIESSLRKAKNLYNFFRRFGFEWPTSEEGEHYKIIIKSEEAHFKRIKL